MLASEKIGKSGRMALEMSRLYYPSYIFFEIVNFSSVVVVFFSFPSFLYSM